MPNVPYTFRLIEQFYEVLKLIASQKYRQRVLKMVYFLHLVGYPALVKKSSQINKEISMKDYSKMTDEELEDEALDLAGEAWEMVKRGYGKNLPKTFEEMVESMREYVKNKHETTNKL